MKPVIAVAGDVEELGPEGVAVNGQRLPDSAPADVDSVGRALPHPISRRYLVAPGELWLARAEQLGQPLPGADPDVTGPRGGAAHMDGRVMRRLRGGVVTEVRR